MSTQGSAGRLLALVGAVVIFRGLMVAQVGLGDDEAYYWLWSQRLSLGYFDHPGGLAWLLRAVTEVGGDGPGMVRLPVVLGGGVLALVFARGLPRQHRMAGALAVLFVPVFGLLGVFAAPDMPFLVAWICTVFAAERLEERPSVGRWVWVGLGLGATLLFKLTGILLGMGLVLWSVVDVDRRRWWGSRGPWMALLVCACVSMPTWWWNAEMGFVTLWFHGVERHRHSVSATQGLGVWAGVHLLLMTPPFLWAAAAAWRERRGRGLIWMAMPCWVVFSVAALWTPTKLHWWAPAWLTVLPAAVVVLHGHRRIWRLTIGVFVAFHLGVVTLTAHPPELLVELSAELRGWKGLVNRLRAHHPDAAVWVTTRYQTASQLAYGARGAATPVIRRVGGRADQFTVWSEDTVEEAGPVLLVCAPHLPCEPTDVPELVCGPKMTEPVPLMGGRAIRSFTVWRCQKKG